MRVETRFSRQRDCMAWTRSFACGNTWSPVSGRKRVRNRGGVDGRRDRERVRCGGVCCVRARGELGYCWRGCERRTDPRACGGIRSTEMEAGIPEQCHPHLKVLLSHGIVTEVTISWLSIGFKSTDAICRRDRSGCWCLPGGECHQNVCSSLPSRHGGALRLYRVLQRISVVSGTAGHSKIHSSMVRRHTRRFYHLHVVFPGLPSVRLLLRLLHR